LRIAMSGLPRTLNPILATQTFEAVADRLATSLLVSADAQGRLVADLAAEVPTTDNGGISADGLTVTYHLRRNVLWHDGVRFTSRDVKFTFDAILNPDNDVISRHGYDDVRAVDTPDDYTVVFHLKRRFAPFVATVFGESDSAYGIIPAHLLAKYKSLNDVPYNSKPVGTGPFRVLEWRRGDRIEFEAFDKYFRGKPGLRKITIRLVPDENTEITLLRSHEIDLMLEASPGAYRLLRTLTGVNVMLTPINAYDGVMMNVARGATADVRVRRAITLALDRRSLTGNLTFGSGAPAIADQPRDIWAFDPSLPVPPYAPGQARKLLAAAGYGPGGKKLSLGLYFDQTTAINRTTSVQVQAELAAIGIDVQIHPQINTVLYAAYGAGGTLARGKYDLAMFPWFAGVDPDDSSQFICSARFGKGFNQSGYCSAAMDRAENDALTHYPRADRRRAYAVIQRLLLADVPVAFLWWPRNIFPANPALHGFAPNLANEAWNAWQWRLDAP
jgi:peptide/nickel transport system substrate-binding protein